MPRYPCRRYKKQSLKWSTTASEPSFSIWDLGTILIWALISHEFQPSTLTLFIYRKHIHRRISTLKANGGCQATDRSCKWKLDTQDPAALDTRWGRSLHHHGCGTRLHQTHSSSKLLGKLHHTSGNHWNTKHKKAPDFIFFLIIILFHEYLKIALNTSNKYCWFILTNRNASWTHWEYFTIYVYTSM